MLYQLKIVLDLVPWAADNPLCIVLYRIDFPKRSKTVIAFSEFRESVEPLNTNSGQFKDSLH